MFENIKVIVSDIDGTLCAAGEKPSRQTIETIEELRMVANSSTSPMTLSTSSTS